MEGIDNPKIFEKLAKKAIKKKVGIIAIKVGKSEAAQAATVSHTASLAGNDSAANALFERLGIARVDDLETFLNSLIILHQGGPLFGNSISSMSCSGGEASLVADLAEELDLHSLLLMKKLKMNSLYFRAFSSYFKPIRLSNIYNDREN